MNHGNYAFAILRFATEAANFDYLYSIANIDNFDVKLRCIADPAPKANNLADTE